MESGSAQIEDARDHPPWTDLVLDFWFREIAERLWFNGDASFDREVLRRFAAVHARILTRNPGDFSGARELLAAIVVTDQFSRNMFRGTPRAFAADLLARMLSKRVIALGLDLDMLPAERHFVYLPFEHSENREDQALAVRLIEALGNASWSRFARLHQETILRFGRFPGRNQALGRASSEAELAFLAQIQRPKPAG